MSSAVHLGGNPDSRALGAHVEGTSTFRPIYLVRAQREQIDPVTLDIYRNLPDCLHRITMENHTLFLGEPADFANWMNRADFIVRIHDRDQHGLVRNRLTDAVRINHAVMVNRQIGHGCFARPLQRAATVEYGFLLGDTRDDVIALIFVKLGDALDREIIGFSRSAGENYFLRLGIYQPGYLVARLIDSLFCFPS